MKKNVGPREQVLRIGLGAAALFAAFRSWRAGRRRWWLGAWGLANLATAAIRFCPSNTLLGIDNTKGRELVHFRGRLGRRVNRLERHLGATFA